MFAGDEPWWKNYHKEVSAVCRGEFYTTSQAAARLPIGPRLTVVSAQNGETLHTRPGFVHRGGNSGFQAVGLAYQLGARRIVLLGYDMGKTYGKSHWHGDHPNGLGNSGAFAKWIPRFRNMAKELAARNVEVINCTRISALDAFPRATIEETLSWQ